MTRTDQILLKRNKIILKQYLYFHQVSVPGYRRSGRRHSADELLKIYIYLIILLQSNHIRDLSPILFELKTFIVRYPCISTSDAPGRVSYHFQ